MKNFQTVRGVKDLLPNELSKIRFIEQQAEIVCKNACYEEISTPIFEFAKLFEKPLGETSDIVTKENYIFQDRSNNTLMLRPEGTTGVVRAAINESLIQDFPKRFFYYGPMFRYERPQKGRLRQFNQFGVELLGIKDHYADIEIIYLAECFLKKINVLSQTILKVNSLGDNESREDYKKELKSFLEKYIHDLSPESKIRLKNNPLRILDSKNKKDIEIISDAPKFQNYLNKQSLKFFDSVCAGLDRLKVNFEIDQSLVRGLDYYSHTAFEFKTNLIGTQDAILAGGRYDDLSRLISKQNFPGVGWAAGLERLSILIDHKYNFTPTVGLIGQSEEHYLYLLDYYKKFLENKINSQIIFNGTLSKKFKKAHKLRCVFVVVLGENEIQNRILQLKNLKTGEQKELSFEDIIRIIKKKND